MKVTFIYKDDVLAEVKLERVPHIHEDIIIYGKSYKINGVKHHIEILENNDVIEIFYAYCNKALQVKRR